MISTPAVVVRDRLAELRALIKDVEVRDGAPPLSDQALTNLGSDDVRHVLDVESGRLVAYAQVDGDSVELVAAEPDSIPALLAEVEPAVPSASLWSHGRHSPVAAAAEARGWTRERVLWQLRRPPEPVAAPVWPEGITFRSFVIGQDEAAWLAVNAAAFAHHAEQGRMTLADLQAREAEPWFDPDGFVLAERATGEQTELVGFHWTKLHPDGLGEVYVLGVAPAAQGLRLGPALLLEGLRRLGGRTVLLYVDDDNQNAVRLYRRFGFAEYDVDVQLRSP